MNKPQLVAPLCIVIMNDGAVFEVQATNWDMLNYERQARAKKWPPAQESPLEVATFVAWHALNREGLIPPDVTYETFTRTAVSVETRRVRQDPTPAEPEDE